MQKLDLYIHCPIDKIIFQKYSITKSVIWNQAFIQVF